MVLCSAAEVQQKACMQLHPLARLMTLQRILRKGSYRHILDRLLRGCQGDRVSVLCDGHLGAASLTNGTRLAEIALHHVHSYVNSMYAITRKVPSWAKHYVHPGRALHIQPTEYEQEKDLLAWCLIDIPGILSGPSAAERGC